MEVSATLRYPPSLLPVLRRPFFPSSTLLLPLSSRPFTSESLHASRSSKSSPGLRCSCDRSLRVAAADEVTSTNVIADVTATGPETASLGEKSSPDAGAGDAVIESKDDAADEQTSADVVFDAAPTVSETASLNEKSSQDVVASDAVAEPETVATDEQTSTNVVDDNVTDRATAPLHEKPSPDAIAADAATASQAVVSGEQTSKDVVADDAAMKLAADDAAIKLEADDAAMKFYADDAAKTLAANDAATNPIEGPSLSTLSSSAEEGPDRGENITEVVDDKLNVQMKFKDAPDNGTPDNGAETADGLLSKIYLKMDSKDTYTIIFYGAGTLAALWVLADVVSAIDYLPVLPEVMEIVGLGFTVWFCSRYLVFKENRDELFSKLGGLKEKIFGPNSHN